MFSTKVVTSDEKSPNPDEIALFESAYKEPIPEVYLICVKKY